PDPADRAGSSSLCCRCHRKSRGCAGRSHHARARTAGGAKSSPHAAQPHASRSVAGTGAGQDGVAENIMRFAETWVPARVVATRDLAPDIREFLLRPERLAVTPYAVGSHINVGVTVDGLPETRSYSLVGEAGEKGFRIAVRRAPDSRGGSRYMWQLTPGAPLDITLPVSLFQIDWTRPHYCLVACGCGITPHAVGAPEL